jgi:hypothetical protein
VPIKDVSDSDTQDGEFQGFGRRDYINMTVYFICIIEEFRLCCVITLRGIRRTGRGG